MDSVGIIGSGSMGKWHSYGYNRINAFCKDMHIEKKTICARHITKDRMIELGWQQMEADWRNVVYATDTNVIDIAACDSLHFPIAKAAIENNKHVICEKPVAESAAQAKELMQLATSKGVKFAVCTNYRYYPAIQCMKKMIESGEIGEIYHLHTCFTMDWASKLDASASWRLDKQTSPVGVLGDLGTHLIDMCYYLGLPFTEVSGLTHVYGDEETKSNDICLFTARFLNGGVGLFEVSRISGGGQMAIEIHGTKGNIRWERDHVNDLLVYIPGQIEDNATYKRLGVFEIHTPQHPWENPFVRSDSFTTLFYNFFAGLPDYPTIEDGYKACKVVDAVLRSSREKKTIRIQDGE